MGSLWSLLESPAARQYCEQLVLPQPCAQLATIPTWGLSALCNRSLSKPESAGDWNSWVTWLRTVCLVWGGGRQEHTNHKLHHFTNLSKRPSWALCIHVEGTIILIPKWNQNPSLCICPVSQLCAPCRKSLNPLASGHFPHIPPPTLANTLPLPQAHVPSHHYLPFLPSGAPGLRHLQCSGWVPQFWHQIALVKSVSKICSKTCSQWWAFCVSVSSSLKWGWW